MVSLLVHLLCRQDEREAESKIRVRECLKDRSVWDNSVHMIVDSLMTTACSQQGGMKPDKDEMEE